MKDATEKAVQARKKRKCELESKTSKKKMKKNDEINYETNKKDKGEDDEEEKENEENEDNEKQPVGATRKIRIKPDKIQKQLISRAMGVVRWTYNQLVAQFRKTKIHMNVKEARAHCVNSDSALVKENQWAAEVPYDLRDIAVRDFLAAWKTQQTKIKNGTVLKDAHFNYRFRSRSDPFQTLVVQSKNWISCEKKFKKGRKISTEVIEGKYRGTFNPTYMGRNPLVFTEPLAQKPMYACTITRNRLGQYHLCIPSPLVENSKKVETRSPVLSIDPGERVFATCYDPSGDRIIEWGKGDKRHFTNNSAYMGKMQSTLSKLEKLQENARKALRSTNTKKKKRNTKKGNKKKKKEKKDTCKNQIIQSADVLSIRLQQAAVLIDRKTELEDLKNLRRKSNHRKKAHLKPSTILDCPGKKRVLTGRIVRRKMRRMRLALLRMSARQRNRVRDFHYKCANWMCSNYQTILLPYYKVKDMLNKNKGSQNVKVNQIIEKSARAETTETRESVGEFKKFDTKDVKDSSFSAGPAGPAGPPIPKGRRRVFGKKTAIAMQSWSHCAFRDRLIHVSRRFPDTHVVPLSEAYTTITCHGCGDLNRGIGDSEEFLCPSCGLEYGRDEGASASIFLRHVTVLHAAKSNPVSLLKSEVVRCNQSVDVHDDFSST